jgi:ubiquinone/menaquinone biosynthesis C-methylase UbiE
MDRNTYIADIYSRFWYDAREKIYGFPLYDQNLCNYIIERVPTGRVLEVAVGTGYPFGDFFLQEGYEVYGTDIAFNLIQKCHKNYPFIHAEMGNAEALPFSDSSFHAVYCFHSTWYFSNLLKSIYEMLRVSKSNGLICFDIQNGHHHDIASAYKKRVDASRGIVGLKYFIKTWLRYLLKNGPIPHWPIVYEVPADPGEICQWLNNSEYQNRFEIYARTDEDALELMSIRDLPLSQYSRLAFMVKKA